MWQSAPFKIGQPEQATCHNPPLTKLTSQILPRHHLLHLTHETLTLIFLLSFHHHGSRRRQYRRPPQLNHHGRTIQPSSNVGPPWKLVPRTTITATLALETCSTMTTRHFWTSRTIHGSHREFFILRVQHPEAATQLHTHLHLAISFVMQQNKWQSSNRKSCDHHSHHRSAFSAP